MASRVARVLGALRNPRPNDPEGRMTLGEHLRELRNRVAIALLALLAVTIAAFFFYHPIFNFIAGPFCELQAATGATQVRPPGTDSVGGTPGCPLYFTSIFQPFLLRLKLSALVAVIATSPVWFYQIWAFITPGLRKVERKWTVAFLSISVPLFVIGAGLAYVVLAKGLTVLLGFVPEGFGTLIGVDQYLRYAGTMIAIFGVAFELPLLILMLNLAGVLTYDRLKQWQRRAVLLIFVFAAIATPSQDPFSMLALAVSMVGLFEASVLLAYLNDKRRGRLGGESTYAELGDDETSPLELDDVDDRVNDDDADERTDERVDDDTVR